MKHAILLLSCLAAISVSAQHKDTEYKGRIDVTPTRLEQKGDSLHVGITFDISGVNVASRQSVTFVPTLAATGVTRQLPAVEVKGRNNYLISKREQALMNNRQKAAWLDNNIPPYTVVKGFGRKGTQVVNYDLSIPYEPWMETAQLDMVENACGCDRAPRILAMSQLINAVQLERRIVITPYVVEPHLTYIQPRAEAVKRREMTGEAFLDFVVSKIDIRPDYMNNPRELKKITDMVEEVRNDPAVTVRSISVIGFASPEGTLAFNKTLSEGRAKALADYLLPRFDFPREMYHVEFGGENWDGLLQKVETSEMNYKEEVLAILRNVPAEIDYATNISRKKSLMQLRGGVPYRYMLSEYYPSLRKAICKIGYEVKGFDPEEAKQVFSTRPQNLSLNEMYLVANSFEPGTPEFVEIFETAVRMFPQDEVANLNAAAAALSRKDTLTAQRYLDRVKPGAPEWYNASGVAAMLRGEYTQARTLLKQAREAGCPAAAQNLGELDRKLENSKLIKSQQN